MHYFILYFLFLFFSLIFLSQYKVCHISFKKTEKLNLYLNGKFHLFTMRGIPADRLKRNIATYLKSSIDERVHRLLSVFYDKNFVSKRHHAQLYILICMDVFL